MKSKTPVLLLSATQFAATQFAATQFAAVPADAFAQDPRFGQIVLREDDVPAYPEPPQGIDARREGIAHVWHVDGNGHDPAHWRNSLYHFSQSLFR